MVYVGLAVRFFNPRTQWLDRFLFKPQYADYKHEKEEVLASVCTSKVPLVITISRFYGSGGHEIGEKLAEKLGIDFFDRKIIDKTAEELGLTPEFIEQKEQNISNAKLLELIMTDKQIPEDLNLSYNDRIFVTQSRIMHALAQDKSCVVIGRCADYILRDHPNKFSVLVFSDIEFAKQRIAKENHLSLIEAEKKIHKTNHVRRNHYWQYTNHKWDDASLYDMVINSSAIGIDCAVDVIAEAIKEKI
jgi:cytidylate kinase